MGFYGEPDSSKHYLLWNLLNTINLQVPSPWLRLRDFNEIMFHHEKQGGRSRSENLMTNFRTSIESCRLSNLRHKGDPCTWSNEHNDFTFTKERLDRALANQNWTSLYNILQVNSLEVRNSDHKPLMVACSKEVFSRDNCMRLFRFEAS